MADPIGSLVVRIGGDATDLLETFRKAGKASDDFSGTIAAAGTALKTLTAALPIAAMARMVTSVAQADDAVGKMAEKVGISVEAMSELKYSAGLANVSLEQLGGGMKNLSKYMAENKLQGVSVEDQVLKIADEMAGLANEQDRAAVAAKYFGKAGFDLIPLLAQGSAGLKANAEEARKLGLVLSTQAAKDAAEFNDQMTKIGQVAGVVAREISGPLIKALGDAGRAFIDAKKEGKSFFDSMVEGTQRILTGDDAHKWNKEFTLATEKFVLAQAQLERVKHAAQSDNAKLWPDQAAASVKKYEEALARAKAEVERLKAIKPLIAPDAPKAPKKPAGGGSAPDLTTAAERDFIAKQLQEGLEEEQRIQGEAWRATAEFRDRQLAVEKAFIEAREAAVREAYDREQEAAIEQGAILLEASGMSHSLRLEQFIKQHDVEYAEKERFRVAMEELETLYTEAELERLGGLQAVKEEMQRAHEQKMLEIKSRAMQAGEDFSKMSMQRQAKTIFSELANITAGVAQHNRALFEANKVAGIAMAIVNAYEGISLTMAKYPFPLNIGMAAAHGIAAFAQVNAIRSASFGGAGGAAPSLAGSTPATPVSPVGGGAPGVLGGGEGGRSQIFNINVSGSGRAVMEEFARAMNGLAAEGFEFRLNGGRA